MVMVGELVVEPFLEPPATLVICNEKSSDDASPCAKRALRDARRGAIPWGRQNLFGVGVVEDTEGGGGLGHCRQSSRVER